MGIHATGADYTITNDEASGTFAALSIDSTNVTLAFATSASLDITGLVTLAAGSIELLNAGAVLSGKTVEAAIGTTIEVGSGASLASTANMVADGLLQLSDGTITAGNKLTDDGVIETTSGTGTIGWKSVTGTGTIEANGGTVDLTGVISGSSGVSYEIGDTAGSVLDIAGSIAAGNTITFLGAHGELDYGGGGAPKPTIDGLNVGSAQTNFIDILNRVVTVKRGASGSGSSGKVVLVSGTTAAGTLTLGGITNATGTWWVDTVSDGNGGTDVHLTSVCYAAGTRILTPQGERPVESLAAGAMVLTVSATGLRERRVRWIGRRRIDLTRHARPDLVAPIRIRRDAVAGNVPHRDLLLSPDHAIFIDGRLIRARQLINGATILQEKERGSVEYFHVELDEHALLLAEGLPAESYLDTGNRGFFSNSGDARWPFPESGDVAQCAARAAASCAPLICDEADVRPIWQRLAERAAALGRPPVLPATSAEPDLCILAAGRTLRPVCRTGDVHAFALPQGVTDVRVVSRAGSPADVRPWLDDRRRLGVYVRRIVLRGAADVREVPVDHPDLSQGWWSVEREATSLRRWTNGSAVLRLPAGTDAGVLEIAASGGGMAYTVGDVAR